MKRGDLVLVEHHRNFIREQQLGIYVRYITVTDPRYSPSFPCCEVITPKHGLHVVRFEHVSWVE